MGTLVLLSCGAGVPEEALPEGALESGEEMGELSSDIQAELNVVPISDLHGVGSRGESPTRIVFATAAAYKAYFGHPAPHSVNWAAGDAVIFYSAGHQPSGGYDARVVRVARSQSGRTLLVTTQLVEPGLSCHTTKLITKPYALAKVRLPPQARYVSWESSDLVEDCTLEENPCAYTLCAAGTYCVTLESQPPQAVCVPNQ